MAFALTRGGRVEVKMRERRLDVIGLICGVEGKIAERVDG